MIVESNESICGTNLNFLPVEDRELLVKFVKDLHSFGISGKNTFNPWKFTADEVQKCRYLLDKLYATSIVGIYDDIPYRLRRDVQELVELVKLGYLPWKDEDSSV
jgi:hypothetical protein